MEKSESIVDFIESQKMWDSLTEKHTENWAESLQSAGYVGVCIDIQNNKPWLIKKWCAEQFGIRHYAWSGDVFWFESEQDSVLFSLRWV